MSDSTMIAKVTPEQTTRRNGRPPVAGREVAGRPRAGRRVLVMVGLVAVALAGALVAGTIPRWYRQEAVTAAAAAATGTPPRVTVVTARPMESLAERILPGNSLPLLEASIYARTTGYLKT